MVIKNILFYCFLSGFLFSLPLILPAQLHNYWMRNFNEESSLLSGAVVGGGSGPSAIYYNPASISEVKASKLSVNASLFSFDFIGVKNAFGDDLNINSSIGKIEPRFLSYMIKSKRHKNWSFEIAILNNGNIKRLISESVDKRMDILTEIPGDERYFAFYQYSLRYRDDWIGAGGSVQLSEKLYFGISMFVTIKSLEYTNALDIEAYSPNDSIFVNNEYTPFYAADYVSTDYLKFNDYRLVWKGGLLYKTENFSVGLSLTTPSLGGIYSDGKKVMRKEAYSNITMPDSGEPVPDYLMIDFKEKKDMQVAYRTPFSFAAGFTYYFPDKKRVFYTSMEFFSKINPYLMVEAEESPDVGSDDALSSDWLTYVSGARSVFNAAIGFSWTLKKDLLIMGGFRTDYNALKNLDYKQYTGYNKLEPIDVDLYHATCGLSWNIKGQDIMFGLGYSVGRTKNQKQIANLSDPVEYNTNENLPLQGDRENTMIPLYNSISIYFGASFNFGGDKE